MIDITNLTKVYGDTVALNDISLSIKKGEIFGIIGKSGAGKSTLIHSINLLEVPTSGSVTIAGVEITKLSGKALREERRKIGMIFQHFNLLSCRTVFDNIALSLELIKTPKKMIEAKVNSLLKLTGLEDKRDVYPAQLSGGQKQRVAIARALANDPEVLLCDEATSALDPHNSKNILNLLKEINQKLGLTIVLITHQMEVVKEVCDRVAILDQGEIVEQGNVLDVFTQPKHALTRELIGTTLKLDLPEAIQNALHLERADPEHHPIIRFTFVGSSASKPFLSALTEKLHIPFTILQANIDLVHGNPVGIMLVQTDANEEQLSAIATFAKEQQLNAEVLGYVHQHHT